MLDHPQRLGILPTRWFWKEHARLQVVSWGTGILVFVTLMTLDLFHVGPLVGAMITVTVLTLAQGLLEKYVRHQAMKRRALAEAARDQPSSLRQLHP